MQRLLLWVMFGLAAIVGTPALAATYFDDLTSSAPRPPYYRVFTSSPYYRVRTGPAGTTLSGESGGQTGDAFVQPTFVFDGAFTASVEIGGARSGTLGFDSAFFSFAVSTDQGVPGSVGCSIYATSGRQGYTLCDPGVTASYVSIGNDLDVLTIAGTTAGSPRSLFLSLDESPYGGSTVDAATFSNLRLTADSITYPATAPEPSTWLLLIAGFGCVGTMLRRRVDAEAT